MRHRVAAARRRRIRRLFGVAICLMVVSTLGVVTAFGAVASPTSTPKASPSPGDQRHDDAAIAATRGRFAEVAPDEPGCTIAVGRDGQVVFAEAYGAARLDPLVPMTTDTVVDIGSTSKQFTATAMILLAEQGLVDLDRSLATYVPDLPTWSSTVTVRQLIHHQSGIPDYIELLVESGIDTTMPATDTDALDALSAVEEFLFAPGERWSYSNSNYFLLAQIVRRVTGDDLGEYLAREVFRPISLDAVMDPTAVIPEKATSYVRVNDRWVVADSPWEQLGDGGIQTTPTQLVAWATQYWSPTVGGPEVNTIRLADAADLEGLGPPGGARVRYGFGFFETTIEDVQILSHPGGWGGFVTTFVVAPEHRVVVAATCTTPSPAVDATSRYQDVGIDILLDWL